MVMRVQGAGEGATSKKRGCYSVQMFRAAVLVVEMMEGRKYMLVNVVPSLAEPC